MTSCWLRKMTGLAGLLVLMQADIQAQESWGLWETFARGFVSADGRVIDHDAHEHTTSEGQAYGLFFSLVANDRPAFRRILSWTESNLASGDLGTHLPAWLWGQDATSTWRMLDRNTASDADLWIAYTLIQAGRLWNDPAYSRLGLQLTQQIAAEEVKTLPGFGYMLIPGRQGFNTKADGYILNASYVPLQIVWSLAAQDPGGPWSELALKVPDLVVGSKSRGWILDWIAYSPKSGFTVERLSSKQAKASYDAIRVYLWAGMLHPKTFGRDSLLNAVNASMVTYLEDRSRPPAEVTLAGEVLDSSGPVGFSSALIPLLATFNRTDLLTRQERRVKTEFGPHTGYYDQCLTLFSKGWSEHNFSFDQGGNLTTRWSNHLITSEDEQ